MHNQPLNSFIRFIIFFKVLYIFSTVYGHYLISRKKGDTELYQDVEYWKQRFEFIFMVSMSFLIIYFFSPLTGNVIRFDGETKFLFFVFGLILFVRANWKLFFQQSIWFQWLQNTLNIFNVDYEIRDNYSI